MSISINPDLPHVSLARETQGEGRAQKIAEEVQLQAGDKSSIKPRIAADPGVVEEDAQWALNSAAEVASRKAEGMADVHSGLDPERVAKLLDLL